MCALGGEAAAELGPCTPTPSHPAYTPSLVLNVVGLVKNQDGIRRVDLQKAAVQHRRHRVTVGILFVPKPRQHAPLGNTHNMYRTVF